MEQEHQVKLLFVCSGNICRSPMAAEYMRHVVRRDGLSDVVVDSAGTLGIEGAPAAREAVMAMDEIGVDLSGHRSKGLTAEHLAQSALVIAMTWDHLDELAMRFPQGNDQRILLRALEKGPQIDAAPRDLADPIGHPVEFYREQRSLVTVCCDHLGRYLEQSATRHGR